MKIREISAVVFFMFLFMGPVMSAPGEDHPRISLTREGAPSNVELLGGVWDREGEMDVLKVVIPSSVNSHTLFRINEPRISAQRYAFTGKVRSDGVAGEGYLELLSTFPSGTYFSRTMSASGPSAKLSGKFNWRNFSLPFTRSPHLPPATIMTFGVRAPEGTVLYLSDLRLVEVSPAAGAWLTERQVGIAGGIFGVIVGLMGALAGILGGRGKRMPLVMGIVNAGLVMGALLLLAGVAGLIYSQPEYLQTALLLGGGFLALIFASVRNTLRRRYQEVELRKMEAQDVP